MLREKATCVLVALLDPIIIESQYRFKRRDMPQNTRWQTIFKLQFLSWLAALDDQENSQRFILVTGFAHVMHAAKSRGFLAQLSTLFANLIQREYIKYLQASGSMKCKI